MPVKHLGPASFFRKIDGLCFLFLPTENLSRFLVLQFAHPARNFGCQLANMGFVYDR